MKTIRLDGNDYEIDKNGNIFEIGFKRNGDIGRYETEYKIGRDCVLVSKTNTSINALRSGDSKPYYYLTFDLDGVPGNQDRNIKKTYGWRGTTNNISIDAHGIFKISKIKQLKNGDISVTVK